MTLLNADDMQTALRAARGLRDRRHAAVQRIRFGADGKRVPATHVRLEGQSARAFLSRAAIGGRREAESEQPGPLAQVAEHPSVQRGIEEEFSGGPSTG